MNLITIQFKFLRKSLVVKITKDQLVEKNYI